MSDRPRTGPVGADHGPLGRAEADFDLNPPVRIEGESVQKRLGELLAIRADAEDRVPSSTSASPRQEGRAGRRPAARVRQAVATCEGVAGRIRSPTPPFTGIRSSNGSRSRAGRPRSSARRFHRRLRVKLASPSATQESPLRSPLRAGPGRRYVRAVRRHSADSVHRDERHAFGDPHGHRAID